MKATYADLTRSHTFSFHYQIAALASIDVNLNSYIGMLPKTVNCELKI